MKQCELCESPARMYCESDEANLCWDCDSRVHGANFLVARHVRCLLCRRCQSPTQWRAEGPSLRPTVSLCQRCAAEHYGETAEGEDDEDEEEEDDEKQDEEEVGDNQVVPMMMSSSSGDDERPAGGGAPKNGSSQGQSGHMVGTRPPPATSASENTVLDVQSSSNDRKRMAPADDRAPAYSRNRG